jgi:hypothetical protein
MQLPKVPIPVFLDDRDITLYIEADAGDGPIMIDTGLRTFAHFDTPRDVHIHVKAARRWKVKGR